MGSKLFFKSNINYEKNKDLPIAWQKKYEMVQWTWTYNLF